MSDAVDTAIAKIDFQHLAGQTVFIDTEYIKPNKSTGFVNSPYVISSLRQQLLAAGCLVQDSSHAADIIVEPRIGTLGSDGHEVTFGIPKSKGISAAAAALSGSPIGILPEISLAQTAAHSGVAKIYVFAYDRVTRESIWQSGVAKAESNSNSTWIMGIGPLERGSIYKQPRFAGRKIERSPLLHGRDTENDRGMYAEDAAVNYQDQFVFRDAATPKPAAAQDDTMVKGESKSRSQSRSKSRSQSQSAKPKSSAAVVTASYEEPVVQK